MEMQQKLCVIQDVHRIMTTLAHRESYRLRRILLIIYLTINYAVVIVFITK